MFIPCAEQPETFWTLCRNLPHWEFELFLTLLFDGLVGCLAWPFIQRHWGHHIARDRQEAAAARWAASPLSEAEQTRRSFAYGNAHLSNPAVTRDMIDRAAEQIDARRKAASIWVVEYQTERNGDWRVSEPFTSKLIAEAACADTQDSPFKCEFWEYRVREYTPVPQEATK